MWANIGLDMFTLRSSVVQKVLDSSLLNMNGPPLTEQRETHAVNKANGLRDHAYN